jgi:formylglycine-generating enzyme required for sulfatase activity
VDKWGLLVWSLAAASCGRLGFDPSGSGISDANGDGVIGGLSCVGLSPSCGRAGTSPCCDSPLVPGGTFYRGYDVAADGLFGDMTHPATVSDFRLDMYEVTVGRFRQFVNAGFGTQANPPPAGAGARTLNGMASQGGWDPTDNASLSADTPALVNAVKCDAFQSWTDTPGANEAAPMNCITWYEAFAFCAWDGGFLPTEAEWNYAAAGGAEQRAYPWSNPASSLTIDCSYANYFINVPFGTHCTNGMMGSVNRVGSESPAGDGKYGQADLAGNVWEWTLDWLAGPFANPCIDCADLIPAPDRVLRGGSINNDETFLRGASRNGYVPSGRSGSVGFGVGVRCARMP